MLRSKDFMNGAAWRESSGTYDFVKCHETAMVAVKPACRLPFQGAKVSSMRPDKSKRIELNPAQGGLAGLGQALTGLNLGSLPPAPVPADLPPLATKRKLGRVVLRKETARRGGKTVIVVDQFPSHTPLPELERLARELRKTVGTGGAVKDRTIEIQGEHPDRIRSYLEAAGYDVAGI
jgi:translation initiation factor 1